MKFSLDKAVVIIGRHHHYEALGPRKDLLVLAPQGCDVPDANAVHGQLVDRDLFNQCLQGAAPRQGAGMGTAAAGTDTEEGRRGEGA